MRVHAMRTKQDRDPIRQTGSPTAIYKGVRPDGFIKPKDLCMMPARLALALQNDGWHLRSMIPWIKNSPTPESVEDRPTNAIEYIFLLTKSADYFYDKVAVLKPASENTHSRGVGTNPKSMGPNSRIRSDKDPAHQTLAKIQNKQNRSFSAAVNGVATSRARRNSDWFFASLDERNKYFQGLLHDGAGEPLAMLVNSQPFALEMCDACKVIYEQPDFRRLEMRYNSKSKSDQRVCKCGEQEWVSHFATFSERLVSPCILAGTSEYGCCQHCGAPYERVTETLKDDEPYQTNTTARWARADAAEIRNGDKPHGISMRAGSHFRGGPPTPETVGWRPTCSHPLFPCGVRPAVVLDPFSGSARTGLAAVKLNRAYVGVELNPNYVRLSDWQYEKWVKQSEIEKAKMHSARV